MKRCLIHFGFVALLLGACAERRLPAAGSAPRAIAQPNHPAEAKPGAGVSGQTVSSAAGHQWIERDGEFLGPKDVPQSDWHRYPGPHPVEQLMKTLRSAPRPELAGQHPRVFVDKAGLEKLRHRARTTHKTLWQKSLASLRALAAPPPPPPSQERRSQNAVGLAIAEAALAYVVEGDPKYLEAAKRYMDAAVSYEVWGYTYNKPDIDLAAGHLLYGMGWAYDLLYHSLSADEREKYKAKLVRQANILYKHYLPKPGRTYSYSQNHVFIPISGLGVAAYALHGEVPEAASWAALSRAVMQRALDTYSDDGFFYESFEYWIFSVPWLVLWTEAHAHVTGEDLFDRPGFRNMHLYVAHSLLPGGKHVFDFGDTFSGPLTRLEQTPDFARTHPGGKLHSNYNLLFKIAARFKNREAQAVAEWMRGLGHESFYDYASLLWFDADVPAPSIQTLKTWHYFPDHEVVFWRTDWSPNATALAFKCGPPEGHSTQGKLQKYPDWHLELGHAHPDAASFILASHGEYLTGDSGYSGVPATDQHNTILVNDKGQAREGRGHNAFAGMSYSELDGIRIQRVEADADGLMVVGDATGAYDRSLGLRRFVRTLTYQQGKVTVVDELGAAEPSHFTSVLHSDRLPELVSGLEALLPADGAVLHVQAKADAPLALSVEPNWMAKPGKPGAVSHGDREARGSRLKVRNTSPTHEARIELVLTPKPRAQGVIE